MNVANAIFYPLQSGWSYRDIVCHLSWYYVFVILECIQHLFGKTAHLHGHVMSINIGSACLRIETAQFRKMSRLHERGRIHSDHFLARVRGTLTFPCVDHQMFTVYAHPRHPWQYSTILNKCDLIHSQSQSLAPN